MGKFPCIATQKCIFMLNTPGGCQEEDVVIEVITMLLDNQIVLSFMVRNESVYDVDFLDCIGKVVYQSCSIYKKNLRIIFFINH